MRPVDWSSAERWFNRLKSLPDGERTTLLDDLSGRDASLAADVASLLSAHDGEGTLDRLARRLVQPSADVFGVRREAAGTTVGPYEIVRLIARGGMGDVYLARDTRLHREVALKFLPAWLNRDPAARDRFLVEARAASSISHPNVCALFDIGTSEDGRAFLVMPYYDGETLKERLAAGPIDHDEAVRLAIEAARGLAAAHERGVVHRDIKPANLLLDGDGSVRILDFGVAKVADLDLTSPGQTPGTARYMSPEQESRAAVDARSDLWSLGAVLHEMLTGHMPPRDGSTAGSGVPAHLRPVLAKLLVPEPEGRYQDALAVIRDLRAAREDRSGARFRRTAFLLAAVILGALALPLALARPGEDPADVEAPVADRVPQAVAVLPFSHSGTPDGLEAWSEGIAYLVSPNLEQIDGLRAIDPAMATHAWRDSVAMLASPPDAMRAVEIAGGLGARYAVLVTAVGAGSSVRLTAEVFDTRLRLRRGSVTVDGPTDSLALADDLTLAMLREGLLPARAANRAALAGVITRSLPAFEAYLEGEQAYRSGRWEAAAGHFVRAAELDSTFARAVYRAWMSYVFAFDPLADDYARQAEAMVDRLSARDSTLLFGFPRDMGPTAIPRLKAYVSRYPEDPEGWIRLGDATLHLGSRALADPDDYRNAWEAGFALGGATWEGKLHLLADAFARRDSGRVRWLLDQPSPLEDEESVCPAYELLYDAAWGDELSRQRSIAAIRSASDSTVICAWRSMAIVDVGAERVATLRDLPMVARLQVPLETLLMRGEVSEVRTIVARALASDVDANWGARYAITLSLLGLGDPAQTERGVRILDRDDPTRASQRSLTLGAHLGPFWLAVRAIEAGRYDEIESEAARTRGAAERIRDVAALDTANRVLILRSADGTDALAAALTAYASFRRSTTTDASGVAGSSAHLMASSATMKVPAAYLRYATGVELLGRGAHADAIRYLRSVYFAEATFYVLAQLQLGRAYEAIGSIPMAREHYGLFVGWWGDADPELQPMVDEARAALARLE